MSIVCKLLRNINEKKATGLEDDIFERSTNTGIFPAEWKLARVTPIFKKGSRSDLDNYRPISVTPIVSKIFERIVYDQLYEYLNGNNLLTNCQSGFRSLHSTLKALLEATNNWSVNIDNGLLNGVVFIDLKAFDTIDHEILLRTSSQAMVPIGMPSQWFDTYVSHRSQKCNVNGNLSTCERT